MKFTETFSKENITNSLKKLGKLRIKVSHGSILIFSTLLLILFLAFTIRVFALRWEIETGAIHLSEFDPYYQYSLTRYMVDHGYVSPFWPTQWLDTQRWAPDGINMALALPGLPATAAFLYNVISALGVRIDLMSFCAMFPAIMGTVACLVIYFLGKDFGGKSVGLFASLFLALSSSFIQRTSVGFFDDETVGIIALLLFTLLFLRGIEDSRPVGSSIKHSLGAGAVLGYFISAWGAAYYPIALTALFTFLLILLKRYSRRLLLAYSVTFGLGLFVAINIPGLNIPEANLATYPALPVAGTYLTAFSILPVAGVFVLLLLSEVLHVSQSARSKILVAVLLMAVLVGSFVALWQLGYMRGIAGKFISVINPFMREGSPLVESVAEHRISSWSSIYYDIGIGTIFFIVGLFFATRNPTSRNLFLLLFGLTSLYFACSMVRLLVVMAPAFSLLASIGIIGLLNPFYTLLREQPRIIPKKRFGFEHVGKEFSGTAVFLIFIVLMTNLAFSPQSGGMPKVIRQAYAPVTITAGSLPVAPYEPVTEWLDALKYLNDFQDSSIVVCSWWDYGYWLTFLGNVTSLADNATINSTQIENVGFALMANETQSVKMLSLYKAKYILVFTVTEVNSGSWVGYGDEGKWTWMAKISGTAKQRFINEGFIDEQASWENETSFGNFTDNAWVWSDTPLSGSTVTGQNSTIYKLMSYGKHRWIEVQGEGISDPDSWIQPTYFKEAFFSGLDLTRTDAGNKYGGLVPLVCIYEVDWTKYYDDFPSS